ncbi:MAG: PAS domain S-box-containing protein [Bacteroidia bacterium]|jgi:PAS domain S-box-containing protein
MKYNKIDVHQDVAESREFFETVFDKIPGMIYIYDLINDISLYRSWSLKKILGYSDSPILNTGKGIRNLVHLDDLQAFENAARELANAKDDQCIRFIYRMKHSDGHWLWFKSEEYVYRRDDSRKPIIVLGYVTEFTEAINLQNELDEINKVNQLLLNAAQILSTPESKYKTALNELAKEVSLHLNVVCDISILEEETGIIRPEALYHPDSEIRKVITNLFSNLTVKKGHGLVGSVIDTGKELVLVDVPEKMKMGPRDIDPRIVPRSMMYVPLSGSDSVLGSLNLTRLDRQPPFSDIQIDQIRRLGKYLSLFVENSLLKEKQTLDSEVRKQAEAKLERDKNWADFKIEVSNILADVDVDLTTLLQKFAKQVAVRFNAVCAIQLVAEEKDEILMVALYHSEKRILQTIKKALKRTTIKMGEGLVGEVAATGKEYVALILPESLEKTTKSSNVPLEIMPSSMAYLPLKGHHGVLGTLNITTLHADAPMSKEYLNQLRDLANHAGKFIENRVLQIRQKRELQLRRKAEQKLERASQILEGMEAETRVILNTIPIHIARVSKDFRYKFLNDTYRNIGIDPRKMEGQYIKEVIGEKAFEGLMPLFEKALAGETVTYDYNGVMADGVHHYFNVALAPDFNDDGKVIGFYSCASDITPKVLAEKTAKLTQDRLNTLTINSGDAFFFHDLDQNIIDVNQVAVEMLGYSRYELLNMRASQIDKRWNEKDYHKFLIQLDVNAPQTFDTIIHHKNGQEIPVEVRFVKRQEGDKTYIQSLMRDRTEKKEQEEKLRHSEERMRLVFENVEDIISVHNEDGIFEYVNKTTQGHSQEDVIGTSLFDLYDKEKAAEIRIKYENLKKTGDPFVLEGVYVGPDGSTVLYWTKVLAIFYNQKFFKAIIIVRDVTTERSNERAVMNAVLKGQEQERKRLGAELHDGIGQIMSAMSLQVSQITEETSENNFKQTKIDLNQLTDKLHEAIREVRNISHDLMPEVLESFGLKEAINQTCNNLKGRAGICVSFSHADVESRYDPLIEVNLYRITQELLTNVQKHAKSKNVFVNLMDHGTSLSLTIEDDGVGFDSDGEKEFKGIGLSNVYSRVNMMNGQIDIESNENTGTLVNIEVPKKVE